MKSEKGLGTPPIPKILILPGLVLNSPLIINRFDREPIESITLIGLCTDICVISNAMLAKAALPEVPIYVDPHCCAGVSPASHDQALAAMQVCQIHIED